MTQIDYLFRMLIIIIICWFLLYDFESLKDNYKRYQENYGFKKIIISIILAINLSVIFYLIIGLINIGILILSK